MLTAGDEFELIDWPVRQRLSLPLPQAAATLASAGASIVLQVRPELTRLLRHSLPVRVVARGEPEYHFEFAYTAEDGQPRRMAVTGRIERAAGGEPIAFAGVVNG